MEWKLSLAAARVPAGKSRQARRAIVTALKSAGGPAAFGANAIWLNTQLGLAGCEPHSTCRLLKSFGKGEAVDALGVSKDGAVIYVAGERKFATSSDAGKSAVWHDLPAAAEHVNAITVIDMPQQLWLVATNRGLFASSDAGNSWTRREAGLPPGRVEQILGAGDVLIATLGDGGVYLSSDRSLSWQRIDHDAERSRFVGLAEVAQGKVLAASQSEGLLLLSVEP
jgi:photosystem II stability/assembly factor-like uncharacterized protein